MEQTRNDGTCWNSTINGFPLKTNPCSKSKAEDAVGIVPINNAITVNLLNVTNACPFILPFKRVYWIRSISLFEFSNRPQIATRSCWVVLLGKFLINKVADGSPLQYYI